MDKIPLIFLTIKYKLSTTKSFNTMKNLDRNLVELSNLLVGQFILCSSKNYIPPNWTTRSISTWILATHNALPIIEIISYQNQHIGWLLGQPICSEGQIVTEKITVDVNSSDINSVNKFERFLYDEFGGRYIAIYITPHTSRIYLDPGGFLAVMFSPSQQIVASSTVLIPQVDDRDKDEELVAAMDIPAKDNWYPFGLTPRSSVQRVIPNYFLNLHTWETKRHWPQKGDISKILPSMPVIEEISIILKRQVKAVTSRYHTYLALTAGRDSRTVLAASRDYIDKIQLFTLNINKVDVKIASQIAKKHNLKYTTFEFQEPSDSDLEQWLLRTSYCVAGTTLMLAKTAKQLNPNYARLGGMAGEVGRCFYWQKNDKSYGYISPQQIIERLRLPAVKAILERSKDWLSDLPPCNMFEILDLLYIEQRCGCWAGIQDYGSGLASFRINPFCHRRIFQLMLSLEPEYRRQQRLNIDLIRNLWPELLLLPFNPHTSWRRKMTGYLKHLWDVNFL